MPDTSKYLFAIWIVSIRNWPPPISKSLFGYRIVGVSHFDPQRVVGHFYYVVHFEGELV
jgi:hypothetical protein